MKKWILLIALLVAQGAHAGYYNYMSGNELLTACSVDPWDPASKLELVRISKCTGYVTGITDAYNVFHNWNFIEPMWCMPNEVSIDQLKKVVLKYLKENPQAIHMSASSLVVNAVVLAFPCE